MPLKPCIVASCTALVAKGSRCPQHRLAYRNPERQRMRQAVRDHVAQCGYWCPGYGIPPHPSTDLTADHVIPRAQGGNGSRLTVLCRSCNARKGSRTPRVN